MDWKSFSIGVVVAFVGVGLIIGLSYVSMTLKLNMPVVFVGLLAGLAACAVAFFVLFPTPPQP
jgi:hypothetical protein